MTKVIDYETNIDKLATKDIPVKEFLARNLPVEKRIGGLLDYGYSVTQIAGLLDIKHDLVSQIMQVRGFKPVNELKVTYA